MSDQPCAGPCNTKWREAQDAFTEALAAYDPLDAAQSRPDRPSIQPWLGEPLWCGTCAAKVSVRLAQLDDIAAVLAATADGHRAVTLEGRVSGSAEPPSPSQAADDLDELSSMLAEWERIYRALKGWPSPPPRGDLTSFETACIAWLRWKLRGILAHPDIAADFGREILQWHRETAASAKAGVRTLRKPLRCPSCGLLTLVWTEGEDRVDCQNTEGGCARVMSYADYESEVEHIADAPYAA
jgi:hypothetical protein